MLSLSKLYRGLIAIPLLLLGACASAPPMNVPQPSSYNAHCAALLSRLEFHIHKADMRDRQYVQVAGYPLLRINRTLEALAAEVQTQAQRQTWLKAASQVAIESYLIEAANLPAQRRAKLPEKNTLQAELSDCAWQQTAALSQAAQWQQLSRGLVVPSEYFTGRRLLGLYPLTNLGMKAGIAEWQADMRRLFNTAPSGHEQYAVWAPTSTPNKPIGTIESNVLGVPEPTEEQWLTLAQQYAPSWVIEQGGPFDIPGTPKASGQFDAANQVYWQPSVMRVHGQWLPQISYLLWFSERPKTSALDLLGGRLDGLVWRVTLSQQAGGWKPLMYDSIHPCGCYHLFFPTDNFQHCAIDETREVAFVPQAVPQAEFAVWVQSATHYVRRLQAPFEGLKTHLYTLKPLDVLRKVDASGKRLFGSNGIAGSTQRLERVLLWTSGLESPGAMRQWGSHATAFSGERYFDEPGLFDNEFCLAPDSELKKGAQQNPQGALK